MGRYDEVLILTSLSLMGSVAFYKFGLIFLSALCGIVAIDNILYLIINPLDEW